MTKIIKRAKNMAETATRTTVLSDIMPSEGGGILNKKVLDASQRARDIVEEATKEADSIRAEARGFLSQVKGELEKARKNGYAGGKEEGLASVAEQVFGLSIVREKFYANAEPEILKLVMIIAEKVIGKMVHENEGAIKSIVHQAVDSAIGERITVRLNPEDHKIITADDFEFRDIFDRTKRIAFKEDETIRKGGCVVETEVGTIDARLETQLKAIKKALEL